MNLILISLHNLVYIVSERTLMIIFPIPKMHNKMVSNSEYKNLFLCYNKPHIVVRYYVNHSLIWLSTEIFRINFLKNV